MTYSRHHSKWISCPTIIPGNVCVDKLAKQGARCPQQNNTASMNNAKQIIKQNKKEDWMNKWA